MNNAPTSTPIPTFSGPIDPSRVQPPATEDAHSVYFVQFRHYRGARSLVLDGGGFQTEYFPHSTFADPARDAAYLDGLRAGYAAEEDDLVPDPDAYIKAVVALRRGP